MHSVDQRKDGVGEEIFDDASVTMRQVPEVVEPSTATVSTKVKEIEIPKDSFLFVSALDGDRALESFARSLETRGLGTYQDTIEKLTPLYNKFVNRVFSLINRMHNDDKRLAVAILPNERLEEQLKQNAQGWFTVSLNVGDRSWCDFALELSRLQTTHGKGLEMTQRPGSMSVSQQLVELKKKMAANEVDSVCLVDDHAFTCRSLEQTVVALANAGIKVGRIVTLSQVGVSSALETRGIPVVPSSRFVHQDPTDGRDILDSLDLVEARYFLLGATGGVVKLRDGSYGRAPYLLPFADASKKASIPSAEAEAFSRKVLQLNIGLFKEIEREFNTTLRVSDGHPDVAALMESQGFSREQSLVDVARDAEKQFSQIKGEWSLLSSVQNKVHLLRLPEKCLFLDLNGTLLQPAESGVPELLERDLIDAISDVQSAGVRVGLCSDSPLAPLSELAARWGMTGPILSENGDYATGHGRSVAFKRIEKMDQVKNEIRRIATALGYEEKPEMYAVDFDSLHSPLTGSFAFGRGRTASLSCFADPQLIEALRDDLCGALQRAGIEEAIACDCNPNCGPYGVAIVHAGDSVVFGKQDAMDMLVAGGVKKIWMIGDGAADAVRGASIESLLVGQRPDSQLAVRASASTPLPGVIGAIEMMREVVSRANKE
jgi:hypothetical protein